MNSTANIALASYTSLGVGGPAEQLYMPKNSEELTKVLMKSTNQPVWVLGYGSNVLISDAGLPGITICLRSDQFAQHEGLLVADAGVWWDDLVEFSLKQDLWGLELMSAIPGSVGAAIVGNIAAYGQSVADTLQWIEVFDTTTQELKRLTADTLSLSYRFSQFQTDAFKDFIILRAAFQLRATPTQDLVYRAALDIAQEYGYDTHSLNGRRQTILETRRRAGSLWDYHTPQIQMHTAGSFFRNPSVSAEVADQLIVFDETGKSAELIKQMNQVHGGDSLRVSAAHVLLAAGFERGQTWGPVRLHPDHILKIENTGGATAQNIYGVAQEIINTAKTKLNIDLVPEVRYLGTF